MEPTTPRKRFSLSALSRGISLSLKRSSTSAKEPVSRDQRRMHTQSVHGTNTFDHDMTGKPSPQVPLSPSTTSAIRNTIRRSLSVVLYASPHSGPSSSCSALVPVLVTRALSDAQGGGVMVIDDVATPDKAVTPTSKAKAEYDNTMTVLTGSDGESATVVWQGYAYTFHDVNPAKAEQLKAAFDAEMWSGYEGLIHPLQLFEDTNLSVTELRRYFDNYGSMMLRIRESRMLEQQRHYHVLQSQGKPSEAWMIPDSTKSTMLCAS